MLRANVFLQRDPLMRFVGAVRTHELWRLAALIALVSHQGPHTSVHPATSSTHLHALTLWKTYLISIMLAVICILKGQDNQLVTHLISVSLPAT